MAACDVACTAGEGRRLCPYEATRRALVAGEFRDGAGMGVEVVLI